MKKAGLTAIFLLAVLYTYVLASNGSVTPYDINIPRFLAYATEDHVAVYQPAFLFAVDGYIRPNSALTRAEAAVALYKLLGLHGHYHVHHDGFTDVYPDDCLKSYAAVSALSRAGIINGFTDGTFRPHEPITYTGFAAILGRAGIPYDIGDDEISPGIITRARAAVILSRKFDRTPCCIDCLPPDMLTWYDNQRRWGRIEQDRNRIINDPHLMFTEELYCRPHTDAIVLHHLHSNNSIHSVHAGHIRRGWWGIGYHFQIDRNGTIWRGRPLDNIGAHTRYYNYRTIGIALQGRFNDYDRHVPDVQFDSLIWLIRYINRIYGELPIYGHRDFSQTSCPGRFFPMAEVRLLQYRNPANVESYHYDWIAPWFYLYIQSAGNSRYSHST